MASSIANTLRLQGNKLFEQQQYSEARALYSRALAVDNQPCLFTNRATCFLREGKFSQAIKDCNEAIQLDPSWARGYERKAEAYVQLRKFQEAQEVVDLGLSACESKQALKKIQDEIKKQDFFLQHDIDNEADQLGLERIEHQLELAQSKINKSKINKSSLSETQQKKLAQFLDVFNNTTRKAVKLEMEGTCRPHKWISLYMQGSENGCTTAMCALSRIYFRGDGVPVDHAKGFRWAAKCVEHGPSITARLLTSGWDAAHLSAQEMLGQAYRHGWGVRKDVEKGESYLRQSADGGDSLGANNLGTLLCEQGRFAEGTYWYRKSAEGAYPRGMCNLGYSLVHGRGCAMDVHEGTSWLEKARDCGESLAFKYLADLARDLGESDRTCWEEALNLQDSNGQANHLTSFKAFESFVNEQTKQDNAMTADEVFRELSELGISPPSWNPPEPEDRKQGEKAKTIVNLDTLESLQTYREELLRLWMKHRPLTGLETQAISALADPARADGAMAFVLGSFFESRGQSEDAIRVFEQGARLLNTACAREAGRHWMRGSELHRAAKHLRKAAADGDEEAKDLLAGLRTIFESRAGEKEGAAAGGQVEDEARSGPEREAGKLEERVQAVLGEGDTSVQTARIRALLEQAAKQKPGGPSMFSGRLKAMPWELVPTLTPYVAAHPESYAGLTMLCAARLYEKALCATLDDRLDEAVDFMGLTVAFDEKVVRHEWQVSPTNGAVSLPTYLQQLKTAAENRLRGAGHDVASSLTLFILSLPSSSAAAARTETLRQAVSASHAAGAMTWQSVILPRLVLLQGCMAAFEGGMRQAQCCFETARELLNDPARSLWPFNPVECRDLDKFRSVMRRVVELDVGRVAMYQTRPDFGLAKKHIAAFINNVPPDTHYFMEAHYELARAHFLCMRGGGQQAARAAMAAAEELVAKAREARDVPVLRPVDAEECGMKAEVEGMLAMGRLADTKHTHHTAKGTQHNTRPGAGAGAGAECCWECGAQGGRLLLCGKCRVAKYCSSSCQQAHWKQHKTACRANAASST